MALLLAPDGMAKSLTVSLEDFSPDVNLKKIYNYLNYFFKYEQKQLNQK